MKLFSSLLTITFVDKIPFAFIAGNFFWLSVCWFVFICYLLPSFICYWTLFLRVSILVMAETIAVAIQVIKALECLTSLASPPEVSGTSQVW